MFSEIYDNRNIKKLKITLGLPWWSSGYREHKFDHLSEKITHAAGQLSPCAATTLEPAYSMGLHTPEPMLHKRRHHNEKPSQPPPKKKATSIFLPHPSYFYSLASISSNPIYPKLQMKR